MATISVAGNTINGCLGVGSFSNLGGAFRNTIHSGQTLAQNLRSLEIKLETVASIPEVSMRTDVHLQEREERKTTALTLVYGKLDTFIAAVGVVDNSVAQKVEALKKDFFKKYHYLKPDSEKNPLDWFCDAAVAFVQFHIDAICWCRDHWKLIVTAIIVVVAVVLIIVAPGAGLIAAIIAGACWGAIAGAVIGGAAGGITSMMNGGSILEGFENGAFEGAITGAISGAISGGLTAAMGPAASMLQSIGRGAFSGAVSNGTANMTFAGLNYFLENGTLEGSMQSILVSGFSGAVSGLISGGISGGMQFRSYQKCLTADTDTAYFWSGKTDGTGGETVAGKIASDHGGTTLENMIDTNKLYMPEWQMNKPNTAWNNASKIYAQQTSGEVRAVIGETLRPGNIWQNVELPTLIQNPNVTKITVIDPKTLIEHIIFTR